jgi:hypothetical protein
MPHKSAKSILEAGRKHVEENGMDSLSNCPRFIICNLAKETGTRSVIFQPPRDVSAAKALRLLDRAAKNDGAIPATKGPGEFAEGWAENNEDNPDLFTKALELL